MTLQKVLLFGDAHFPYHHVPSWNLMLRVARDWRPRVIVCLGDLMDCYSISRHDKDPARALRFPWEVEESNRAMDELDALGARDKRFVEGNHEDRLRRLMMKQPELAGLVSIPKLLRLHERGWKYTGYKRTDKLGKLHLTHDVGSHGRYAVHKAIDIYEHTVATGDTHRLGYIVEGNATGECKLSASFGWLGDVEQIDYIHLQSAMKNWALGFGLGYHDTRTDYVYLTPVPIINGTCVVEGKLYR